MSRMKHRVPARLAVAVTSAAVAMTITTACKQSTKAPPPAPAATAAPVPETPYGSAIARASQYRTEVCACKDAECLKTARHAAGEWKDQWKEPAVKPTAAEQKQITDVSTAAHDCESRVTAAGLDGVIAKLTELERRMCTCPDPACGEATTKEMASWTAEMSKTFGRDTRPSPDQVTQMKAIGDEYAQCYTKLASGTGVPPGPATP